MGLACLILAVLLLAMDTSLLNVFDLAKAGYSHALAWILLGVLVLIAASDGVRVPRSPLFIAFYCVIAVDVLTTIVIGLANWIPGRGGDVRLRGNG